MARNRKTKQGVGDDNEAPVTQEELILVTKRNDLGFFDVNHSLQ